MFLAEHESLLDRLSGETWHVLSVDQLLSLIGHRLCGIVFLRPITVTFVRILLTVNKIWKKKNTYTASQISVSFDFLILSPSHFLLCLLEWAEHGYACKSFTLHHFPLTSHLWYLTSLKVVNTVWWNFFKQLNTHLLWLWKKFIYILQSTYMYLSLLNNDSFSSSGKWICRFVLKWSKLMQQGYN